MSNKVAIGLHGIARSGKDLVGQYLVDRYGFTRVSFADEVRDALLKLDPMIPVLMLNNSSPTNSSIEWIRLSAYVAVSGWDGAKENTEVRELLQRMGTEVGRNKFGEDVWLKLAEAKLKGIDKVVFTDVRFENESEFIENLEEYNKNIVFRVYRPDITKVNDHASENELPSEFIDEVIVNDQSIDQLYHTVDYYMSHYNL